MKYSPRITLEITAQQFRNALEYEKHARETLYAARDCLRAAEDKTEKLERAYEEARRAYLDSRIDTPNRPARPIPGEAE